VGAARALFERYHHNATTGYHIWSSTLQIKGPNCGRLAMERHLTPFDAMNWVFPKLLYLIRVKRNVIQAFALKIVLSVLLLPMINCLPFSPICLSTICSSVAHV
jgi:hypothetical protein